MSDLKFGTDGWRGVIADDFTFAKVERVSQAAADFWSGHAVPGTERKIVIGYDHRFLSSEFAARTAEVFAGNDFARRPRARPDAAPLRFFRGEATPRHRWRDDHRQPQPANIQRL